MEKENKKYSFFYGFDSKPNQVRFHLEDDDPLVKNKVLLISTYGFKTPVNLFYEKHFERNNLNVVEHYSNDQLNMYFETENKGIDDTFETKGYDNTGCQFFYRLFKENKEYEMTIDGWVSGENGVYPFADIGVRIKKL